ncbi:hypothetical protein [Rubrivirga sp. IMCC43871]|uniref:hypothetical protein n=1 Tax=Rubrivirga sp. IMCC43871 TaxID=3391575 RepID=UPI00398F9AEE
MRVVVYHEPACVEESKWTPLDGARIGWMEATAVPLDAYGEARLPRPPTPSATLYLTPSLSLTYPVLRLDAEETGGVNRLLVFLHRFEPIDGVCDITQE